MKKGKECQINEKLRITINSDAQLVQRVPKCKQFAHVYMPKCTELLLCNYLIRYYIYIISNQDIRIFLHCWET